MGVGGVMVGTASFLEAGAGSNPSPTLQRLLVSPIPSRVAKQLLIPNHYLHSMPGGTQLCLGVFVGGRLAGVLTLGVGPKNAYALVDGAEPDDCQTLTRLWLSDELLPNSESRVLGVVLRSLRRETSVKFLVTYADPAAGHSGIIYQASNWVYTGRSQAMPLLDIGDGVPRHSRSLAHAFGTHSRKYFEAHGITVRRIPQAAKHRYLYFLDRSWRDRLRVPVLPYPKKGHPDASD